MARGKGLLQPNVSPSKDYVPPQAEAYTLFVPFTAAEIGKARVRQTLFESVIHV